MRRAYPFDVSVEQKGETQIVEASHAGFCRLPGHPVHRRRWVFKEKQLEVYDTIDGEFDHAVSRLYLQPDVLINHNESRGSISWGGHKAYWKMSRSNSVLEPNHWHPEFGSSIATECLVKANTPSEPSCRFKMEWD